jgi:hypothetical protein
MRRQDMLDVLGRVPVPEVHAGMYLIDILFRVGPIRHETPLVEADLEPYERRRGIELEPWQADLLLDLSKAYFAEMHSAKNRDALCPWEFGRNIWTYVKDQQNAPALHAALEQPIKESASGTRKRHRNPPTG